MPTKSQLETMVKDLEATIQSLNADRGMFHTALGQLALEHDFQPLLNFLNFTPEELTDLKDLMP